jgi:uncharacterized protein
MLAFNVAALLKAPPGTTRDVVIDEPGSPFGPDLRTKSPVRGTARLFRTQDGIVVRAALHTTVEVDCSRCLETVSVPISAQFDEEFRPVIHIATGAPLEPPEDEALRIDERHTLDLTETARQYLLTDLPLNAVCSDACQGLCPRCGANLNEGPCGCDEELPINPFAALARMLPLEPRGEPTRGPRAGPGEVGDAER